MVDAYAELDLRCEHLLAGCAARDGAHVGQRGEVMLHLGEIPHPADRDGYIAAAERDLVWASRRYRDPAALRALAAASYDRCYYPAGIPGSRPP